MELRHRCRPLRPLVLDTTPAPAVVSLLCGVTGLGAAPSLERRSMRLAAAVPLPDSLGMRARSAQTFLAPVPVAHAEIFVRPLVSPADRLDCPAPFVPSY